MEASSFDSRKRWLYVFTGFILLLCLGLIYAWSIFVAPLEADFGWSRSETSLAFTICMCMFCIGGLAAGFLSKKFKNYVILSLCAVFVLIGFISASQINTLTGLYITYGVCVGFGIGLSYNAVLSTVTKWFPDKGGLISGILLTGFGLGGMVLGTACTALINVFGWRLLFRGIGLVFFVLIIICACIIKPPSADFIIPQNTIKKKKAESARDFTTGEMLRNVPFWLIFVWAVLLTSGGLTIIGHASPIAVDMGLTTSTAAIFVGLISVFNGCGRIVFGTLFDILGNKKTMLMISLGFIVSGIILMASLYFENLILLAAGFIILGLSYGGIMPTNSTIISQFYGTKNYSTNFSMITMNVLLASPLGQLLGGLQGSSGSYFMTFLIITILGVVSILINKFIRKPQ